MHLLFLTIHIYACSRHVCMIVLRRRAHSCQRANRTFHTADMRHREDSRVPRGYVRSRYKGQLAEEMKREQMVKRRKQMEMQMKAAATATTAKTTAERVLTKQSLLCQNTLPQLPQFAMLCRLAMVRRSQVWSPRQWRFEPLQHPVSCDRLESLRRPR